MAMKAPEEHQRYLSKRNYPLLINNVGIFTQAETTFLHRYGFWLEALMRGDIEPITDDQRRLVSVCCGEMEPKSMEELAWWKLCERRKWEADASPHYVHYDPGEAWFRREAHWRYH
jgi:uncharacterized protein YifE (UPF0438 family)